MTHLKANRNAFLINISPSVFAAKWYFFQLYIIRMKVVVPMIDATVSHALNTPS